MMRPDEEAQKSSDSGKYSVLKGISIRNFKEKEEIGN